MSRALDEKPYGLITKEVEVELNIRAGRMVNRNLLFVAVSPEAFKGVGITKINSFRIELF